MPKNDNMKEKAQDIVSMLRELEQKLELPEEQKIIDVEFKDTINLGGDLNRNSVFVVKVKNKNGETAHIIIDKECNKIANIDKDGKIELSEKEIELWEKFIGKPGVQIPEQKKRYDFEKEYILEEYKTNEKTVGVNDPANKKNVGATIGRPSTCPQNQEEQKASDALNVSQTAIIAMIKIEDRETFGQAINKKLYADAYIVRYGNNKTKIMQMNSNGKLTELEGVESNEFNLRVLEQLNLDKTNKSQKIKSGDLTTIRTEDNRYSYVVVREHDSKNGIVIVNSGNETRMYVFDDEGKVDIKEIETSIKYEIEKNKNKDNEKDVGNGITLKEDNDSEKDDDDEGRTPWGDAYSRSRR